MPSDRSIRVRSRSCVDLVSSPSAPSNRQRWFSFFTYIMRVDQRREESQMRCSRDSPSFLGTPSHVFPPPLSLSSSFSTDISFPSDKSHEIHGFSDLGDSVESSSDSRVPRRIAEALAARSQINDRRFVFHTSRTSEVLSDDLRAPISLQSRGFLRIVGVSR